MVDHTCTALSADPVPQLKTKIHQDSSPRTPSSRSTRKSQSSSGGSTRSSRGSTGSLSPRVTSPADVDSVPPKSIPGFSRAPQTRGTTPPKGNRRNYGVMADPKIELSPYGQSDDSVFVPSESWLRDEEAGSMLCHDIVYTLYGALLSYPSPSFHTHFIVVHIPQQYSKIWRCCAGLYVYTGGFINRHGNTNGQMEHVVLGCPLVLSPAKQTHF